MRYDLSMHTLLTDEELIRLAQVGDELAFAELMSRYSSRIWRVIIANSRQPRDAEEILMDVWRAVWENISGLRNVRYRKFKKMLILSLSCQTSSCSIR